MRREEKPRAGGTSSPSCHRLCHGQLFRNLGEADRYPRATPLLGLELQLAAVQLRKALRDRQAEADTPVLRAEAAASKRSRCGVAALGMPTPWSSTENTIMPFSRQHETLMVSQAWGAHGVESKL